MEGADRVRCAVYTRKSSEEGLSQAFNSLHSQREYCEAYIKSQGGEGWTVVPQRYDDGGFSGASMARPGLQRLLSDIDAKLIDAVVVYKVDRLTRSLADFARILERLDRQGAAFVSVTQAFNTQSSMGRLTLNVLLSFAQFEREVTGERIRDKIAASKAKGMWMGGLAPLGYDLPDASGDRRLRVNEAEAIAVRSIFERLIQCRSFYDLQQQLMEDGIRSKPRRSPSGVLLPGVPFSRGALRHLLRNQTYLGLIPHKGQVYEGRHEAIVDRATFDAVQALLHHRSAVWKRRAPNLERAPLQGRLFDTLGQRMRPMFVRRKGKLYGYYVAPRLMPGLTSPARPDALTRVPSRLLDDLIRRRLADLTGVAPEGLSTAVLREVVVRVEVHGDSVQMVLGLRSLKALNADLRNTGAVEAKLYLGDRLLAEASRPNHVRITIPIRMKMRGGRTWLEDAEAKAGQAVAAARLAAIKRLRAAHRAFEPARPALVRQRQPVGSAQVKFNDISRIDWVFLAPVIQSAILNGRLSSGAIARLQDQPFVPSSWAAQRRLLELKCPLQTPST